MRSCTAGALHALRKHGAARAPEKEMQPDTNDKVAGERILRAETTRDILLFRSVVATESYHETAAQGHRGRCARLSLIRRDC